MVSDQLLARLLEKVEGRYYGKYRAFVVDNDDKENRGRLRLRIPSVLGNDVVSGWALPCAPYGGAAGQGFLFVPEKDAGVWVEFEEGNLDYPIWVGSFWGKPGGESESPKPNDPDGAEQDSVQEPPTRKIIKTKKGHTIQFEDKDGEELVILLFKADDKKNLVMMDKDGIVVKDASGNKLTLSRDGITVEDKNSNVITMDSSSVTIKSKQIKIGDGATEPLVLGTQLKTALQQWITAAFQTHVHTGNLGAPTSPPMPGPPLNLDPALSPTNTVK